MTDPVRRGMIEKLLREEEQKLKLAEKKPEKIIAAGVGIAG